MSGYSAKKQTRAKKNICPRRFLQTVKVLFAFFHPPPLSIILSNIFFFLWVIFIIIIFPYSLGLGESSRTARRGGTRRSAGDVQAARTGDHLATHAAGEQAVRYGECLLE